MARLGMLIDLRTCIGCHACSVACKAEFDVPLGVFRDTVKYVESGKLPAVTRHFIPVLCNHREDAPCPTRCRIFGDLDDPTGEIGRKVAANATTVWKGEAGTRPRVLYIDPEDVADLVGEHLGWARTWFETLRENAGLELYRRAAELGLALLAKSLRPPDAS